MPGNPYIPAVKNLLRTYKLDYSQKTDDMTYHRYKAANGDALEVLQSDATITVSCPAGTYVFDTVGMRDRVPQHFGTNLFELFPNANAMLGRVMAETESAPAVRVKMGKLAQDVGMAFVRQNRGRLTHELSKDIVREAMATALELPKTLHSAQAFARSWHPTGNLGHLKADFDYKHLVAVNAVPSENFFWAHAAVAMTVNDNFTPHFLLPPSTASAPAQSAPQKAQAPAAPRMGY